MLLLLTLWRHKFTILYMFELVGQCYKRGLLRPLSFSCITTISISYGMTGRKKSNAHLAAYSFPLNSVMPVAFGATAGQFNNLKATKVMYVRSSNSVSGAGHFVLNVCNLLVLSAFSIDLSVMQATIAKASPAQLLQIPQLPAPILTSAEEKMLIDMTRQGGPEKNVQEFIRKLAVAKDQLTKANEALKNAGSLRTTFEKPLDKALGFDVAKAVEVLKIPHADRPTNPTTTPQTCQRGAVYCVYQKRCLPVAQKCSNIIT